MQLKEDGATLHIAHSTASRVVKGEDTILVSPLLESIPQSMLYVVCDGHVGKAAARFASSNLHRVLCAKMPQQLPESGKTKDLEVFGEGVRRAVCEAFAELDNGLFAETRTSGTSVTALLLTGRLLTIANIGDCHAVLDTGCYRMELTNSHRLADSESELSRMRSAGCLVAPLGFHLKGPAQPPDEGVGPLRLWPGGLCVSRSIGDFDSGPHVSPIPHVKQVLLSDGGCRVVLATDGLWDCLSYRKALSLVKMQPIWSTAAELVRIASQNNRVIDDTSVVVVDLMPDKATSFRHVASQRAANLARESQGRASLSGAGSGRRRPGLFACFSAPPIAEPEDSSNVLRGEDPGIPMLFADVDGLTTYPDLTATLKRHQHAAAKAAAAKAAAGGKDVPGCTVELSPRSFGTLELSNQSRQGVTSDSTCSTDKGGSRSSVGAELTHAAVGARGQAPGSLESSREDQRRPTTRA